MTLTYDNQSGTGCSTTTGTKGTAWGTLCTPTRSGYAFQGWYTAKNGAGSQVTNITIASSNLTVYAKWVTGNFYTVTYNNNIGTGCTSKQVASSTSAGTLCTPTRTGYTFLGWTTYNVMGYSDSDQEYYSRYYSFSASTTVTGNVTVYAAWKKN